MKGGKFKMQYIILLIFGIIATIISSLSYILLNAYTGMAMCFIAIIRNLLFKKDKKSKFYLILILILTVVASIFTFDSPIILQSSSCI